jgi:iron complex outermembrane recepter protein
VAEAELTRISGSVNDRVTGETLVGVRIEIRELKRGALSKSDGSYEIREVPHGIYTIYTFSPGYQEQSIVVDIHEDTIINFSLMQKSIRGDEVIVTSSDDEYSLLRHSQAMSVLEKAELDEHRGQTLGETLEQIPGVRALETGASISKPIIRGLHSDRVILVNAGIVQEGQQWGAEHAPEVDQFAVSRIEVIKGASGIEYGAGAIGGIINIEPRTLRTTGDIGGEADINLFSNNLQGSASLLLETPFGSDFGARFQMSGRYAGDSRTPDYVIGNTGFRELNGSAAFGYKTLTGGVELYYSRFASELGIYKGSHFGNKDDLIRAIESDTPLVAYTYTHQIDPPKQNVSHGLLTLKGYYTVDDIGKLEMQYGYQRNDREEYDAHLNRFTTPKEGDVLTPSTRLLLSTYSFDTKLHHVPIGTLYGTTGVSIERQNNSIGGKSVIIPPYLEYSGGLYIVEHYLLGPLSLDGGVRYDITDLSVESTIKNSAQQKSWGGVSGSVGMNVLLTDDWSLSSHIGSAWRPPSVNELYSYGVHHGSAQFEIGDSSLDIERSYEVDLTLRHRSTKSRLELSLYYNSINNYIYSRPDTMVTITIRGAYPTFYYSHTNATIYGLDVLAEYQLFDALKIGGSVSMLRGDNITDDEPLYQMPSMRTRGVLHFDLPEFESLFQESFIELSGTYVAEQSRVPAFTDYAPPPPAYTLFDITLSTHILAGEKELLLSLSMENMFNTSYRDYLSRYRYFIDEPGMNIILRLSVPFGDFHNE